MFKKVFYILLLSFIFTEKGFSFPVEDLATEYSTAQSLVQEIESVKNQIQQLQYEASNSAGLKGQQWDNAQAALTQLSLVINKINSLNYSMSDIDSQYQQHYPGYTPQGINDYSTNYKSWVQTNQATMNGVLDQMNVSYEQQQQEIALDELLKNQASNPAGRMQAIQVGNEIAAEEIAQLQKVKATMMAQTNAQAEYYAYESQKDAAKQQSVDEVVQNADSHYTPYQDQSQFGLIPDFD